MKTTAGSHVLLVEDDLWEARLLRKMVKTATDGRIRLSHFSRLTDAIEKLGGEGADAVLLSLHLPDADGLGALRRLKAAAPRVPVILLARPEQEPLAINALHRGAQDYLLKGAGDQASVLRAIRYAVECKRSHEECARLSAQLARAQRLESVGLLASGIAHNFNNLLAVVLGNASMMLGDKSMPEKARQPLADIVSASERGAALAAELLGFARSTIANQSPCDLNQLVQSTAHLLERTKPSHIELKLSLDEGLSPVAVDASQMDQVLMNLCVNAFQAIRGHGRVEVHTQAADLSPQLAARLQVAQGSYVLLQVKDTGCGMDAQTVERVFDPFFTTKASGHGLGLPSALGIVRAHGGQIRLDSAPGLGTTVSVWLPTVSAVPGDDSTPLGATPKVRRARRAPHRPGEPEAAQPRRIEADEQKAAPDTFRRRARL